MADTVYDVTTWAGATVSPYVDIGAVINQIIADIKSKQTTQTTRPGAVIYIPPGHYDLLTRVVIDISFLQIKGSGHGFLSEAIRDESPTGSWVETLPGASHIRVKNNDGHKEAFLVSRSGAPSTVGRLNSIVFQDFCLNGVASTKPYTPGNSKIGISFQSDNDAVRIEGMGFVYLEHAIIIKGADAPNITNNFIAECGYCIELTGASQVAKITNNFLISAWGGYSVFAENGEGLQISGNTVLWACNITLHNVNRASITSNKLLSNFPSMIALLNESSENLIASNHFRRVYGDGTSTRFDDKFGLVHIAGSKNTLTSNQFSFSVPSGNITPAGADPTIVLVKSGDNNYLAANHITSNLPAKVVLDASTTATKVLYSATSAQFDAYTSNHAMVPTP
ncbi:right-handed parallel beta-helix repeat-containing protein [Streptomyces sp. PSKA54]|uniref:Right-handed parallel beta-helix repeat-containing protein n=1 Tax=Streptomyces himalayensis subsp. aureolus TaxID=2758039 RepID=A0A7W2HK05_9ACTN|nr:NosD domain-containing protein [Streptomyces himalayensis]MBA4866672.1 right-handed parallel beta-helix repeat-containing protein [Streptomyces himalayensis subsp. aureolus]